MSLSVSVAGPRLVAMIGIGMLWATSVTSAQMTPERDPREHARSHVGPFYITPTVELAEVGVETNVFNEPQGKADLTSTLVPRADVWIPFANRALITASGTLGLVYYQTYATERSVNPDARLRGDLRVNRVTLFAASSYSNSRRQPNLEIDARARHETTGVDGGAEARLTERLGLELGASEQRIVFAEGATFQDTSLRETLNRRARTGWTSAHFDVTPLTRVSLRGQYTEERFPFSPVRDADTVSLVPGVDFQPRALISGSASVGIRRFQPKSSHLPGYTGVVASANLSYTLRGASRFTFTAIHDLAYSYNETEPYYVIGGYGVSVTHHLGGRFDARAGGDWQAYRYQRLTLLPDASSTLALEPPQTINHMRIWSAGLGYRLWRTQRLGLGATYRQRDASSQPELAYSGLRLMVTVDSAQ